jgi:hypothetical protein
MYVLSSQCEGAYYRALGYPADMRRLRLCFCSVDILDSLLTPMFECTRNVADEDDAEQGTVANDHQWDEDDGSGRIEGSWGEGYKVISQFLAIRALDLIIPVDIIK